MHQDGPNQVTHRLSDTPVSDLTPISARSIREAREISRRMGSNNAILMGNGFDSPDLVDYEVDDVAIILGSQSLALTEG